MKPGAVVMAAIVIVGGGVLLYRWRRAARIEAREDAADVAQVLPYFKEYKAREAAGELDDEFLTPDEALRLYHELCDKDS